MKKVSFLAQLLSMFLIIILLVSIFPKLSMADGLEVLMEKEKAAKGATGRLWSVLVSFNYPVFTSDVKAHLDVRAEGKEAGYEIRGPRTGDKITGAKRRFRIVPDSVSQKPRLVQIVVKKGLFDATGRRVLPLDRQLRFEAIEKIHVQHVSTFYRSLKDRGLIVRFSRKVPVDVFEKLFSITPKVTKLQIIRAGWRGIQIRGDFEPEKKYIFKLAEGKILNGQALLVEKEYSFTGPGKKSQISFNTDHSVIELRSRQLLPITLDNVTKIQCNLSRIPPYLVPEFAGIIRQKDGLKKWSKRTRQGLLDQLVKSRSIPSIFGGHFVEDAEVFFAPEAEGHTFGYSVPLSFRKERQAGGTFWIRLADPDRHFRGKAKRLVQITDLSISYKKSQKSLLIWVTSVHTGEPVEGAQIMLCEKHVKHRYFPGKTNKHGVLQLKQGQKVSTIQLDKEAQGIATREINLSDLKYAVAATPKDYCFANLNSNRLSPHSVKQVRANEVSTKSLNGYIFTERGIYQPDETVHFKFVARQYKDKKIVPPSNMDVEVKIIDPKGDEQYTKTLSLNEFGTCNDAFKVAPFLPVGTYTIRAKVDFENVPYDPANRREKFRIFTKSFKVAEYKIPRHYVSLSAKKEQHPTDQYVTLERTIDYLVVTAKGRYYTGGPVKHGKAKWKATLVPAVHKVKGFKDYFFGNAEKDDEGKFLESGESILDEAGNLVVRIPLDRRYLSGLFGIRVSVTVLDIDGEPATDVTTFNPKPRFWVGISRHPSSVQQGAAPHLRVIVVDDKGKKVTSGAITASLLKSDEYYVYKRDDTGRINYLWEHGWMKTFSSQLKLKAGIADYQVTLNDSGSYMLAFTYEDKKGQTYTSRSMVQVGWDEYERYRRWREEREPPSLNRMLLSLAKKTFKPGEKVAVSFHTERPVKKCLVALERDNVFEYKVIDVNGKNGTFSFTASDTLQPNVYISAIATTGRNDFPLYRGQADMDIPALFYGYTDIKISQSSRALRVEIDPNRAELKARPGEKTDLSFKVTDDQGKGVIAEMAVCVVDEAVLALTRFATPQLTSLLDFDLPLSVFSGDLRLALISQDLFRIFTTKPLTGGGFGKGIVSQSIRERFDPVAYFNPTVVTDASGKAKVGFTLPDTTTKYRVYVVACDKGARFASEQRDMLVTKEFFIEPSVPRFLVPGDHVVFPIVLNNKTNAKGNVSLKAKASKDLNIKLAKSSIEIAPQDTESVFTTVDVVSGMEKATLEFEGQFSGDSGRFADGIRKTFPIHSRFLPVNRMILGQTVKRAEINVDLPKKLKELSPNILNPRDLQARLTLTTTNWNKIAPGLKYLLRYPYGCVEQTSSGVIPLARIRSLIKAGAVPDVSIKQVDKYLKQGIERLASMQVENGGFAYWPGRNDDSWWGSIYASFALTAASEAGYNVPEKALKNVVSYIRNGVFDRWERHANEKWTQELALYVLAVNKALTKAELEKYFSTFKFRDNYQRAVLILAANKIGYESPAQLREWVENLDPKADPMKSSYYNSSYRTLALCLLAAIETRSETKKKDLWAGYLMRGLKPDGRWYSTADTGWCLAALAKYFESQGGVDTKKKIPCRIKYANLKPINVKVSDIGVHVNLNIRKLIESGKIIIESDKKDLINYTLYLIYPDITHDPSKLREGFTLVKRIENLNGKEEIRVGDTVRVILEMNIPSGLSTDPYNRVEYLALEDPLPAGLAAINSDLETEGEMRRAKEEPSDSWSDGFYEFTPSFFEFRNDRVRVFKNQAWAGSYKYSYLARAVSEGTFWMRGSRISLMYDPDTFGKTKGKIIKILPAIYGKNSKDKAAMTPLYSPSPPTHENAVKSTKSKRIEKRKRIAHPAKSTEDSLESVKRVEMPTPADRQYVVGEVVASSPKSLSIKLTGKGLTKVMKIKVGLTTKFLPYRRPAVGEQVGVNYRSMIGINFGERVRVLLKTSLTSDTLDKTNCSQYNRLIANAASEEIMRARARGYLTCLMEAGWTMEEARKHVITTIETTYLKVE